MFSESNLVEAVINNNELAKSQLYNIYSPKMYGICLRFARSKKETEDMLQEGFIKVFMNLNTFRNDGSLGGWIRRTVVNTSINIIKKNSRHNLLYGVGNSNGAQNLNKSVLQTLNLNDLQRIVMELPTGYRTVFNLFAIEGYSHIEISNMLDISENTSKSQLSRARKILKLKLSEDMKLT